MLRGRDVQPVETVKVDPHRRKAAESSGVIVFGLRLLVVGRRGAGGERRGVKVAGLRTESRPCTSSLGVVLDHARGAGNA